MLSAVNSPFLLGNPAADALEPALKILVNIAYPDVVTPSEGGTYNRTFLQSAIQTPFGSVQPLTPEEKKAVPGDVWNAFVGGVEEQLAKPFLGIIVPNPAKSAATTAAAAATPVKPVAASPAAAVEVSAPAVAPGVSAPVAPVAAPVEGSVPAAPVGDPAPVVKVSAPVADPVPAVQISAPADDPAPAAAPRGGAHRGRGTSSPDHSAGPRAAGSSGRNRSAS